MLSFLLNHTFLKIISKRIKLLGCRIVLVTDHIHEKKKIMPFSFAYLEENTSKGRGNASKIASNQYNKNHKYVKII